MKRATWMDGKLPLGTGRCRCGTLQKPILCESRGNARGSTDRISRLDSLSSMRIALLDAALRKFELEEFGFELLSATLPQPKNRVVSPWPVIASQSLFVRIKPQPPLSNTDDDQTCAQDCTCGLCERQEYLRPIERDSANDVSLGVC